MASVALSAEEMGAWTDRVEVAAVNGPKSVVIAGDAQALDGVLAELSGAGVRVRRIAVDYASHTRHVEDIREVLAESLAPVTAEAPAIPFYSTVTGGWIEDAGALDGDYWYRNLRQQVAFGPAVAELAATGHGVFIEVSAHPVLLQPIAEATDALVTGTLRREDGGLRRLFTSMAELFVRGISVDWAAVLPAGATVARVDLPTYAFDHQHYWLQPAESVTDAASLGQAAVDHPLLGAVVRLPGSDGLVFTSRLSLRSHAWLGDHRVGGVVLVPGTALVELAVRAGDEADCGVLDELVIEAPLVVPERGGVRVQVTVGGPGQDGTRTVDVYSLRDDADVWTRHATGVLAAETTRASHAAYDFTAWPPPGARPVDVEGFYDGLVDRGYGYGPVFQGVRAVWRRGDEAFAEVALPEEVREDAGRFGVHPALLDAALQAGTIAAADDREAGPDGGPDGAADDGPDGGAVLAFAWNGLVLHASGASALRVRVVPDGPDALAFQAADETGEAVLTLDSLVSRAVSAEQLEQAGADTVVAQALHRLEWAELPPARDAVPTPSWVSVATADEVEDLAEDVAAGADVPAVAVLDVVGDDSADAVLALTSRVLGVVQAWLAAAGLEESRLVVVTRGAVPAGGDDAVHDPAGAAVWGLVRAAQAESPDRIVLLDADPADPIGGDEDTGGREPLLGAVLAGGEPQIAARGTALSAPRLARADGGTGAASAAFRTDGTVLVSGGGALGGLVARHLVSRHGVRRLLLASRRGPDAEGVAELVAELGAAGAEVSVVACDLSDRVQVAALLASVRDDRPLTGVVHTAGVFDDGLIASLTPERLATVYAPKVDAVRHLHELTRERHPGLDAFIVFSSVAGLSGGAGQGNYAAANAYLDALMAVRRAAGLPGLSLAWGLWEDTLGMAGHLSRVDRARASRSGVLPIGAAEGMALFDAAVGCGGSLVVPVKLDVGALRAGVVSGEGGGGVPYLLRGLVRVGRQSVRAVVASGSGGGLRERLAGLDAEGQEGLLLELVRVRAAAVLGHGGPEAVRPDMAFRDAGFDSLTSVELRNRVREATGLKLPATLVFDHPTPLALAAYLLAELGVTEDALARVHAKIEDVESLIVGLRLDDAMKSRVAQRLQGLVARCNGVLDGAGVSTVADQLESASADELFDFIDDELGLV
ncbi:MAG TPA: SDR family NAD(P)-dependent oxidoreductase [Streptomyces sp.]|nr:SDR family NAD(P)-dependent oxidoreductase [Streptomyces sp.]